MIIISKNTNPDSVFAIHKAVQEEEITPLYSTSEYTIHKYDSIEYPTTETVIRKDENGDDIEVEVDVIKRLIPGDIFTDKGLVESFPKKISRRQFFQELGNRGIITEDEALDAGASVSIPAAMEIFITSLPEDMHYSSRQFLRNAQEFNRGHILAQALEAHLGYTEAEVDDIWIKAAALV